MSNSTRCVPVPVFYTPGFFVPSVSIRSLKMSPSCHSVGLQVQVCLSVLVHASACSCICRSVCWLADVQGLGLGEEGVGRGCSWH